MRPARALPEAGRRDHRDERRPFKGGSQAGSGRESTQVVGKSGWVQLPACEQHTRAVIHVHEGTVDESCRTDRSARACRERGIAYCQPS